MQLKRSTVEHANILNVQPLGWLKITLFWKSQPPQLDGAFADSCRNGFLCDSCDSSKKVHQAVSDFVLQHVAHV